MYLPSKKQKKNINVCKILHNNSITFFLISNIVCFWLFANSLCLLREGFCLNFGVITDLSYRHFVSTVKNLTKYAFQLT